jgi:hypothetical protein
LPGNPPNLDVALERADGFAIGIESKFTEWLTPKSASRPPFKEKYFPSGNGVWDQVGLTATQQLAESMQSEEITFRYLDAPQLIKHALGLATHLGGHFRLPYIYFDCSCSEAAADIIIVEKRETAENGESVVAMINGEQVTLKRFYVEADGIRLQPANPAMEPIYLRHEELQILGIVAGVIRQS